MPSRCHQASSARIAGRLRGPGGEAATLRKRYGSVHFTVGVSVGKEWLVSQSKAQSVALVTLPDDGPTGGFFRDRKPLPW